MTNAILSREEIGQVIIEESIRTSKKHAGKSYHIDETEMQSWLNLEVFQAIEKKPEMANLIGIRHIMKLRSVDYIRECARHNVVLSYHNTLGKENEDFDNGDRVSEERNPSGEFFLGTSTDPQNEYLEKVTVRSFLKSLHIDDRQVVELTAGFTRSLSSKQLDSVKELIDRKAVCHCGIDGCKHNAIVWFTQAEVGNILGCHRNTVKNRLKRLKDQAIEFGLEY
jgi:hypothetical protein